uniref:Uncharacterized protein n=1 Tax=Globodera rostochiensis TaxID=31243 RepID=A0A914H4K3_GLORO
MLCASISCNFKLLSLKIVLIILTAKFGNSFLFYSGNPGQLCCCINHLNLRPTNGGLYKGHQPTAGGTINAAAAETTLWRPFCKFSADSERLLTGEFNEADELKVPSKNGPPKLVAAAAKAILVQLPALLVQRQEAASTECGQYQNSENDRKTEEEKESAGEEEETERGRNEEEEEEREGQPGKESASDKREQKVAMDDGPCGSNNINNKQYPRRCCCECAKNCDSCYECSNNKDGVAIDAQKVPLKLFKPFFAKKANFGVFNSPPKQQIDFVNKASEKRRSSVDESFENLKQRLGEISHKLDFWKTNLLRKPEEEGERFSTDRQQSNRADQLNMLKAVINKELSAISVTESLTKTILENGDADKDGGRGYNYNSTAQTEALLTSRTLPASTSTSPSTITTTTRSSLTTQQKIVTVITKEVPTTTITTTTTMPTMIGQNVKNVTTDLLPGNGAGGHPQILQGPPTQRAAPPPVRRVTEKPSPSPPPPSTLSPPQLELPTPPPYTAPNVPATSVVNTEVATAINGGTTTTPSSSAQTTKLIIVSQRQQNADDINNEINVISPSVMPTTISTASTTTAAVLIDVKQSAGLTTDSNSSNMTTILLATTTSSTNAKMFDEGKGTTAEKENNATMELFVDRMQFDENNLLEQIHNVNLEDPQITTNGRPISLVSSNFASKNTKESKHQISQFNEHLPPRETHGT